MPLTLKLSKECGEAEEGEAMFKRLVLFIIIVMYALTLGACAKPEAEAPEETPQETATPTDAPQYAEELLKPYDASEYPIGMLYSGPEGMLRNAALHGFLRTSESLGYPAEVFAGEKALVELADEALQKGCKGLVVWAQSGDADEALQKAQGAKVPAVAVYGRVQADSSVNLFTDDGENAIEAVKLMLQELEKRKHPSGAFVLVTDAGSDKAMVEAVRAAIRKEALAYSLLEYNAPRADAETALSEAVQYYKQNTQIVAAVCFSDALSTLWTSARKQAEADLKPTPTPKGQKSTPTPTPVPSGATPAPTPLTKLDTVIVGVDYSKEHIALTQSGALYGFIARPYFDGGAQGCILLDQMLRGTVMPEQYALYAPLVRKDGCAKYESVVNEVNEWFGS